MNVGTEIPSFKQMCWGKKTPKWWLERWSVSPSATRWRHQPCEDESAETRSNNVWEEWVWWCRNWFIRMDHLETLCDIFIYFNLKCWSKIITLFSSKVNYQPLDYQIYQTTKSFNLSGSNVLSSKLTWTCEWMMDESPRCKIHFKLHLRC